jgi:hypothetical protein
LDARKATGAINNTIPLGKDAPAEICFKLKQTGEKLVVEDIVVAIDPDEARRIAAEGPKLTKADIAKMAADDNIQ